MYSNRRARSEATVVSGRTPRAGKSRPSRGRIRVISVAAMVLTAIGVGPAQAGVWDNGRDDLYVVTDHTDYCGIPGFSVREVMDARIEFVLVPHGPEGFPYWISSGHGEQTWTNVTTGATLTKAFNILDRDLEVTDNGDGTATVVTLATGGDRWYGPDGKLLFRNPGQVRLEFLVDANGEWYFVGVVKGSTGRNDTAGRDFCTDAIALIGS